MFLLSLLPLLVVAQSSYLNPGSRPQFNDAGLRLSKNPQFNDGNTVEDSLDAGMVQSYLASPIMDSDNECHLQPNGTSNKPAFFQCDSHGSAPLILHGGAITDQAGDSTYPVSFRQPVRIFLDITSESKRRFDNLSVDIALYRRTDGWLGCGWMFLPSFGMLGNKDICIENPSCPIGPGRQVIEFTIDPSRLFTRFFRMVHHKSSAYQLIVNLRDKSGHTDLLCTTIQTRIQI